jgi:hypothetical protein
VSSAEEVDGDAEVAGFHLGDAGLAGADEVGDVGLGVAEGFSPLHPMNTTSADSAASFRMGSGTDTIIDSVV